ncbi:GDP-mannose 4,6-dehydratase [uncultured Paludibaculum sp.]|uniref:GDP-mannose 4,6-dehydratase n=1 Tax=uncultured Paludibaculum sp. TaxID=1765020 RepID=UPI002AAAA513|nr:GDP-mannose 4,6-dehydratase [uncultured Paludibaculum sp.]
MRILITGGAGFIGSHTAERVLVGGHETAILDDLNDFYEITIKEQNLALVGAQGSVALYRGDIRDGAFVDRVFQEFRPEAVVHLAARAGVRPSLEEPVLYTDVNCLGTAVLLEAARRAGTHRFVFASSSSVYGLTQRIPFQEDDPDLRPISPYAGTKLACERLSYVYSHLYGIKVVCLRFFTVYGPRQRPDLAISKFIECVETGREIPFFGDGQMGRDYTFVSDTIDGILAALNINCPYGVFNLGNSFPVTLSEMVAEIERATHREAKLRRLPVPPGDVPITYADLTKSEAALGYRPKVLFAEGIRRTVEWYRAWKRGTDERTGPGAGTAG